MPALVITQAGDPDLGLIRAVADGQPVAVAPGLLDGGAAALRAGPAGAATGSRCTA